MSIVIRSYQRQDNHQVIALWKKCGLVVPANDPQNDIDSKVQVGRELFLIGLEKNEIVASVMGGYEGHRGWINYLAVDPLCQGNGYGRNMVEAVESLLLAKGCPKVNLQVRTGNTKVLDFYRRLGYQCDDVVSLGKRL